MANQPLLCWFEQCTRASLPLVGGKCSSLGELINAGVRVPPGFALTTEGVNRFIASGRIEGDVRARLRGLDTHDTQALENTSAAIRQMIEATPLPIELEDAIAEGYRKLSVRCGIPAAPVAVRSSATAEDLPDASFAGQQDTYLWIRGADEVTRYVRRCISSLYSARAIAYRAKKGFSDSGVAISVGVQKMVNSYAAGVMFTLHPTNGDRSVIVIDSSFGFGESVVSGEVTPDHFIVNKVTLDILERRVSTKQIYYTADPKTQTSRLYDIPFERQQVQSLIDDEIIGLAAMGKKIEKHYGHPVDIEWAVEKDLTAGTNLFILQARPETAWSRKGRDAVAGRGASAMDYIVSNMLQGKRLT